MALPLPWRSSTSDGSSVRHYISGNRRIRIVGIVATFALILLSVATIAPLTKKTEYTEAATGTASETKLTITTANYPTLDLSVNNLGGTFTETAAGSGQGSFSVTTTNYTGYTLSISASDNTSTLINSSDSNTSTNSITSIPTGSSLTAAEFNNATYNGKWGYKPSKLNSEANTNYLPAPTTEATTLDETSAPNTTANTYTIDLAARLQYTQNSGDYTKTFVLTAVANKINYSITYNPSVSTPSDVTNMPSPNPQSGDTNSTEITLSASTPTREGYTFKGWCTASTGTDGTDTCSGTTYQPTAPDNVFPIDQTTINTTTLYAMWEKDMLAIQNLPDAQCTATAADVKDIRDNQVYTVQRLADGKCWMMTNLNLGATTLTAAQLDDTNTHITNGSNIATSTFNGWRKTSGSTTYTAAEYIPVSGNYSYNSMPYGTLYNYCAASAGTYCFAEGAGTGNATSDICPKGWRLPTGGSSGEFKTLYGFYNTSVKMRNSIANSGAAFTSSGSFYSGSPTDQGSYGRFWSSTRYDGNIMYHLYLSTSDVDPANIYNRYSGFSIRCVKQSDTEINETMQSVTNDQLAAAMPSEGSTASLRDARDDQVYTLTKINGNYWMTQNLAYVGDTGSESGKMTMKSTTSNISADTILNYSDLTTGNDYSDPRIHIPNNTNDANALATLTPEQIGVWYNYAAASAGTITGISNSNAQTYDVCPKGWRLPTQSEFSGITSYSSAFPPVKSGGYSNGSPYNPGTNGNWWSATPGPNDAYHRYTLYYDGSSLYIGYGNRYFGFSVRCIHKSDAEIAWEAAGKPTLQDFTSADASTMNTGDTKVLADTRDNQLYTVSKLADGRVWMLDNLALGSTSTMTLTNSDTNITASSWTLPASISSGFSSYTAAQINIDSKYVVPTPTYGTASNRVGVYYNYCAASAGGICTSSNSSNGSANRDICPKGWRLPTGGSSGEFQTLYNAYGNHTDFTTALSTSLSGSFSSGSADYQGSYGYWWSSTRYDNTRMYNFLVYASDVNPQNGSTRNSGFSIRCILK